MPELLRIKPKSTFKDILALFKRSADKIIYLYVPVGSSLGTDTGLNMVKKAAVQASKKIAVVTNSRVVKIRAEQIGLTVLAQDQVAAAGVSAPTVASAKAKPAKVAKKAPKPPYVLPSPATWLASKTKNTGTGIKLSKTRRRILVAGSITTALLAGLVFVNFAFQNAVITVKAKSESQNISTSAFLKADAVDLSHEDRTVPAKRFTKVVTQSGQFQSTGKESVGDKAAGNISLVSRHSQTLRLRASTTYLVGPNQKRYRFVQDVSGLTSRSPQTLRIIAEEAGQDSNLPAGSRLEVYNSAFGHQPQVLYATVGAAGIDGGGSETQTVVSQDDINKAQAELKKKIIDAASVELQKEVSEEIVVLEGLTVFRVVDQVNDSKEGEKKPFFNMKVTAEVSGLAATRDDLDSILTAESRRQILADRQLLGLDKSSVVFTVNSVNHEEGVAEINASYVSRTFARLDVDSLKSLLADKSPEEIREILLGRPDISSVNVDLSPFWLQKTPGTSNRLDVKVETVSQ